MNDAYPSGWFHARAKRENRPRGDGGRSEGSDDDDEEGDEEMEERGMRPACPRRLATLLKEAESFATMFGATSALCWLSLARKLFA